MTTRKLKHYFLMHTVQVISDQPLQCILESKEATWWITQWAVEIGQYDVKFIPRWAIKSEAVVDFIIEWTDSGLRGINELPNHWVMYFDGSYTLKGVRDSVMLILPGDDVLKYAIQLEFLATNNIVEYEGLVTGLRLGKDLGILVQLIRGDSQLVAKQVQKEYDCSNAMMIGYLAEVCMMEKFFDDFQFRYVPHLDNHDANHLAWIASSKAPTPPYVIVEKLSKPSIKPEESIREAPGADQMVIDEQHNIQHMIGCARSGHIWITSHHQTIMSRLSASHANLGCIT
jgi:ribonuclease HI